jgi:hypothetical protein
VKKVLLRKLSERDSGKQKYQSGSLGEIVNDYLPAPGTAHRVNEIARGDDRPVSIHVC